MGPRNVETGPCRVRSEGAERRGAEDDLLRRGARNPIPRGSAHSSRAGQPGAEAEVQFEIQGDAADEGTTPGAVEGEFSQLHLGSTEACLA